MKFEKGDVIHSLGLDMNCNNVESISEFVAYIDIGYVWFDCIIRSDGFFQYADSTDFVKTEK